MATERKPQDDRFVSIGAKLIAVSGVLLVGSMLLYGYVAYVTARAALLPSIREQLADDAVNVKGGLEEMLAAHWQNVHTWAGLTLMRELVVHDMDKTVARFLEAIQHDYGVYLELLALDPSGVCVASSDPADIGVSFADSSLSPGRGPSLDERPTLEWSQRHRAAYVRLAAPIPDPDREDHMLGTLVAMLDREVLDRIVVSKPGHSQIELRLLDDENRLIAGHTPVLAFQRVKKWLVETDVERERFPPEFPPLLREGSDGNDRSWLIATVPIGEGPALPALGWELTAAVPKDVVLAPVRAVRDRVLATGIVLILFGLAGTVALARRISGPIQELTDVASRIAKSGDLEPVPAPHSRDEVGQLALAFQRMVTALEAANEEMVRASKLAFLGEMAAGMAHEIRTPLGIIRNSAQLIERRMQATGDPETTQWALFIREEADRLARVVTDLLDFVKPVPPAKSRNDLREIARRSSLMLSSEASTRGVDLRVVEAAAPVVVACDADQIHQVCLNLVMNALQATPRGGEVRVVVSRSGDRGELDVRDTGPGIPQDIVDRLFEPFTSHRDGGIGLGLAIVRRIVRAHGGEVSARNRLKGGAEFTVSLPLSEEAVPVDGDRGAES